MRYIRRLINANPSHGRHLTISIPKELAACFKTDTAIIEALPDGNGVMVRPARVEVEPLVGL